MLLYTRAKLYTFYTSIKVVLTTLIFVTPYFFNSLTERETQAITSYSR